MSTPVVVSCFVFWRFLWRQVLGNMASLPGSEYWAVVSVECWDATRPIKAAEIAQLPLNRVNRCKRLRVDKPEAHINPS